MVIEDRRKGRRTAGDIRRIKDLIERYEFLIQNTRDIVLTIRRRDGKILDANAAAVKAYRYTLAEFLSMTVDRLGTAPLSAIAAHHPDEAGSEGVTFEATHIRKNGKTFPVRVVIEGAGTGSEKTLLCMIHELTGHRQVQDAMHETENNMRALLNAVTESLLLADKDGTVLTVNDAFARRLRIGVNKIIGANYYDLLPADTAKERRKQAEIAIRSGKPVRFEDTHNKRFIDQVIYPVFDRKGRVARLAFFGADITRRREMEKELESMALTDQLTGLFNRRGFFTLARRELKRAERSANGMLLFFADLDGLKSINDHFGHKEGDRALIASAKILAQTFRTSDIVSRIGGDEFAILVIDADEAMREKLLLRLDRLMNNLNARKTVKAKVAISIGHAVFDPGKPVTLDELLSRADQQMYKMKKIKYRRA